uniref:Uncharacterized protein n=1 Tax=Trichobilharzia regenti TaxID=157069 RepID=A0AA85JBQ4_TRIRE|nr:unnamed protein product [Trichobilharzia regenti]
MMSQENSRNLDECLLRSTITSTTPTSTTITMSTTVGSNTTIMSSNPMNTLISNQDQRASGDIGDDSYGNGKMIHLTQSNERITTSNTNIIYNNNTTTYDITNNKTSTTTSTTNSINSSIKKDEIYNNTTSNKHDNQRLFINKLIKPSSTINGFIMDRHLTDKDLQEKSITDTTTNDSTTSSISPCSDNNSENNLIKLNASNSPLPHRNNQPNQQPYTTNNSLVSSKFNVKENSGKMEQQQKSITSGTNHMNSTNEEQYNFQENNSVITTSTKMLTSLGKTIKNPDLINHEKVNSFKEDIKSYATEGYNIDNNSGGNFSESYSSINSGNQKSILAILQLLILLLMALIALVIPMGTVTMEYIIYKMG